MSDVIRLLPDSVANQIAAGEVIQRPASVVKELVENAVDAGADDIQIIVRDAGRTLIQVIDNGCGMSDTDARIAFERHATSKISQAADLFALHTMGFRGEALASIAAVARIDLRTMLHGASIGTRLIINGSRVESQEPEACAPGSNLMVKSLFFNVPARRKFLKKDSVELANIMREFERLALVNPTVEFTIVSNDSTLHKLMRGSLKQRIVELFGKSLDKQLLPIETETSIVKISGFIGLPQHARRRNALQYFFVNGRNMRHPYFHKAIMTCYEQLLPADMQPNYFVNFTVDPQTIDVNIHPTKHEIKFEDEQAVWQILVAAVKESLGRFNAMPGIDFDSTDAPEIPVFNPNASADHSLERDANYNPFAEAPTDFAGGESTGHAAPDHSFSRQQQPRNDMRHAATDWERLYEEFAKPSPEPATAVSMSRLNIADAADEADAIAHPSIFDSVPEQDTAFSLHEEGSAMTMQLKDKYILTPSRSGLMIIDQHRAHLRILFERYMEMTEHQAFASQSVMFPEVVRLSPAQNAVLSIIAPQVQEVGFDISYLGDNSWSLNGAPAVLGEVNPVDTLLRIIDDETEGGEKPADGLRRRIALSLARAAAVKAGTHLTPGEMDRILSDLFKLTSPNYTPDGQLIIAILSHTDISAMFA